MPNWTSQAIYTKNKEDLEKIKKEFTSLNGDEQVLDFNKIIEFPEPLRYTRSPNNIEHIAYFLSENGESLNAVDIERKINDFIKTLKDPIIKEAKDLYQEQFDFKTMERIEVPVILMLKDFLENKKVFEYGKEQIGEINEFKEWCKKENIEPTPYNYGKKMLTDKLMYDDTNWYDWSYNNWGTKWDLDETIWNEKSLWFQTAWSPVLPIYVAISEKLQIDIFAEWVEEQFTEYVGVMQVEKGEVTLFKEFKPNSRELFKVASAFEDEEQENFRYDTENKTIVRCYDFEDYDDFDKFKKIKTGNKYLEKFLEQK